MNIDALVENGGLSRIDADPALLLNIQPLGNRSAGPVRATGMLNGGGEVLKLRTTVGRIQLQFLDADTGLRDSLISQTRERIDRKHDSDILPVKATSSDAKADAPSGPAETSDWLESWMDKLEIALMGGLHEDSSDLFKRLIAVPHPVYPELAKRAHIQGVVIAASKGEDRRERPKYKRFCRASPCWRTQPSRR